MPKTTPRSEPGIPQVPVEAKPSEYYLDLPKLEGLDEGLSVAVFIRSQYLGGSTSTGDVDLGARLITMFLASLCEMPPVKSVILVNDAVRLACGDSPTVTALETIEKQGTEVLCCSTSCNYFKVDPAVGLRTSMFHIVETLLAAGKVITV